MAGDIWHFPRTTLASHCLDMFQAGLTSALTLFSPRRMGKTEFLLKDLRPIAETRGYRVVYVSLWQTPDDPAAAIIHALQDALQPNGMFERVKQTLQTPVQKVSLGAKAGFEASATLDLGGDQARPPEHVLLQMDRLLAQAAATPKRPLLLLIDEVQHLGADARFAPLVAALRTSLDKYRDQVKVVFTGSSRDGLTRLFQREKAPLFHFSQQIDLPELDRTFVKHIGAVYRRTRGRSLDEAAAWDAFQSLNRVPLYFRQMIERMILTASDDVSAACQETHEQLVTDAGFVLRWATFKALDREMLKQIALGHTLYGQDTRTAMANNLGLGQVPMYSAQNAVKRLLKHGIVVATGDRGRYVFEDPAFRDWVLALDTDT